LSLVSLDDSSPRPLSEKLLDRPRMLAKIAAMIPNRQRCHLIPYNTTGLERDIALTLGIPMYGADPRLFPLGTKTGCRRLFARAGVRFPAGVEDLHSRDDLEHAALALRAQRPGIRAAMVKLNEGVSGSGNAVVELTDLPEHGTPQEREAVAERVQDLELEDTRIEVGDYLAKLEERGGIVEERVVGDELRSPSVQMRVTPLGEVEVLSTHDQVLGGPSGQSYLGCRFPADRAYARLITQDAQRIGDLLASEGVLGRFAVDFVTVRRGEQWQADAIEVNLRKGGTTHPFSALRNLVPGRYDTESGTWRADADGSTRAYRSTDNFVEPSLAERRPQSVIDAVREAGLQFDGAQGTGVVLHMLGCLAVDGRFGATAIGRTLEHADELYAATLAAVVPRGADAVELSR
jgi:hypothetical protein